MVKLSSHGYNYQYALPRTHHGLKCMQCNGTGVIYEFYNDPVTWKICDKCRNVK